MKNPALRNFKSIKNIKFIKQKKEIHEQTRMLIEDSDSYRYEKDDIGNACEYYYNTLIQFPEGYMIFF